MGVTVDEVWKRIGVRMTKEQEIKEFYDEAEKQEVEIDIRGWWAVMHNDLFICAYASRYDIPKDLEQFQIRQITAKVPFKND